MVIVFVELNENCIIARTIMKSSLRVLMTDDIQKVKVAVKLGNNEWRSLFMLQIRNFQSLIFY